MNQKTREKAEDREQQRRDDNKRTGDAGGNDASREQGHGRGG